MPPIEPLSAVQKSHIQRVLSHAQGDLALAGRILGVTTEDLLRLLASHGLDAAGEASRPPRTDEEEE
ncbi:MAG: hypothetical protein KQJ78_06765 [Deltaproteobacteria bacterium]|nr:hypothetical protein [Deltaproteobacteria bacterium]